MHTASTGEGGAVGTAVMSHAQAGAARAGLRALANWSLATTDPQDALLDALRREDPTEAAIGLATVARMLAVELALRSDRDEVTVLANLDRLLDHLQTP